MGGVVENHINKGYIYKEKGGRKIKARENEEGSIK